jgi:DNA-binding MurR/RpiR family transcriptional regulator
MRNGLGGLTPAERKCASVLLANYPVAGLQTVAAVAAAAGVSGPTVLRLVTKLGFSGYGDFQKELRDEISGRVRIGPIDALRQTEASDGGDLLDRFRRSLVRTVEQTLEEIPKQIYDEIEQLLSNVGRPVTIIGGRFTSCVAAQLALQLRELRPGVQQVAGPTARWPEYLIDISKKHVVIVFDIRAYQRDVIQFAREAARRGADIILITDIYVSPIASVAKHIVAIKTDGLSSWESMTTLSALVETIMVYLSGNRWPQIKNRVECLQSLQAYLQESGG